MNKYQDRHLQKINNAINIAYLTTAILWGVATCSFTLDRKELNQDYASGEISKEEFLQQSKEFSLKEESFFKDLAISLGVIFTSDVSFELLTRDKEL